jgi:excisionase family DNA binding protein
MYSIVSWQAVLYVITVHHEMRYSEPSRAKLHFTTITHVSLHLEEHKTMPHTIIRYKHIHSAGGTSMAEEPKEDLLTVREVARRLRVDDTTVRRWIKSGALEAITLPHMGKRQAYRIKLSTLNTLLHSSLPLT